VRVCQLCCLHACVHALRPALPLRSACAPVLPACTACSLPGLRDVLLFHLSDPAQVPEPILESDLVSNKHQQKHQQQCWMAQTQQCSARLKCCQRRGHRLRLPAAHCPRHKHPAMFGPPVPRLQEPGLTIPTLLPAANISGRQRRRQALPVHTCVPALGHQHHCCTTGSACLVCTCFHPAPACPPARPPARLPACLFPPACSGAQLQPGAGGCGALSGAPLRTAGAAGAAGRRSRQHSGGCAPLNHAGGLACLVACMRAMC
jgi:hypothetical protein